MHIFKVFIILLLALFMASLSYGGEADVIEVKVVKSGQDTYQFHVTVLHDDEGWKHYANKWDVVASDGTVLGTRTLYHPHVDEQPFTRSLSDVKIPASITEVIVRAHDSVHEYGGKTMKVIVPK